MLRHSHLPRLEEHHYQGHAIGHWTFTIKSRVTGWLEPLFHARLREAMLHACTRYRLAIPVYCLMPDHAHFLLMGLHPESDQRLATSMIRREFNQLLPEGICLQRQAYDHILRDHERERAAFETTANYILANPVRAGLVEQSEDHPFSGSIIPGYPSLDPHADPFWKSFWLAYQVTLSE